MRSLSSRLRVRVALLLMWAVLPALAAGEVETYRIPPGKRRVTALPAAGLIVYLNCGDGTQAAALCGPKRLVMHCLAVTDADLIAARKHIRSRGLYGRVSVSRLAGKALPYADNLVNLLVADGLCGVTQAEVVRVLAPGGVAHLRDAEGWMKIVKPRPDTLDEWTHNLHGPGGNPVGNDRVAGPPRHLQWTAGPRWARSHGYTPSVTGMVSAGGRMFAIVDETLTGVDDTVPSTWSLIARDAFNGVLLWRRPMEQWGSQAHSGTGGHNGGVVPRFTMPSHAAKRLVAVGDTVYVTLSPTGPVTALNAATGTVRRVYEKTERTDEILHLGDRLILKISPAQRATTDPAEGAPGNRVCAVDVKTGKKLWQAGPFTAVRSTRQQDPYGRLELAAGDGSVFALTIDAIHCLDAADGTVRWKTKRPALPAKAVRKMGFAATFEYLLSVMVYQSGVVLLAQPEPNTHHTYHTMPGTLHAFDAASGKKLWSRLYGGWGHCTQPDVFVVGENVWTHVHAKTEWGTVWGSGKRAKDSSKVAYRIQAIDLRSGEVRQEWPTRDLFHVGHHHRCYRNRSTVRYLISSRRGVELVDLATGENYQNHWVRSGCLLGNLPCNGLLYVAPHPCGCYIGAKLTGFNALSATRQFGPAGKARTPRLQKGPAQASIRSPEGTVGPQSPVRHQHDWPTYRHDPLRSGATESAVPATLRKAWQADLGTRPSGLTMADGRLMVAGVDKHTVHAFGADDGKALWTFTADGRVDSPPTIDGPRTIFGSTDGHVYCLRAEDGALAWRFRAAPHAGRVVARGQLESPWPVPGSVLVQDGLCWFAAGRSSYLDGGIRVYALEPGTGKVSHEQTISHVDPKTNRIKPEPSPQNVAGLLNDIPGSNGSDVFVRQQAVSTMGAARKPHLFTTGGFLDDSWFNRTFWTFGRAKSSGVMVLGKDEAYAVELYPSRSRETVFKPGASKYRLVCYPLRAQADRRKAPKGAKPKRRGRGMPPDRWSKNVPIRITAMVRAADVIFVAGSPDVVDPKDPHGAWEGRKGGVLAAFATADGKKLHEYKLPAPPVWDGLAAARGRLYLALQNGTILAFEGK